MKTTYFLSLILLIVLCDSVQAQVKKKVYRVRIELFGSDIVKGHLRALNDSSIWLRTVGSHPVDTVFLIREIKVLSFRRKNAILKGFIIGGLLIGPVIGSAIVFTTYSSPKHCDSSLIPCYDDLAPAVNGSLFGLLGGSLLGFAAGSQYKDFVINGQLANYHEARKHMLEGLIAF